MSDLHQQYQILQYSLGVNCTSMKSFGQFNKGFKKFSAIQQPTHIIQETLPECRKTRSKCADGTTAATQRRPRRWRLHGFTASQESNEFTSAALTSSTELERVPHLSTVDNADDDTTPSSAWRPQSTSSRPSSTSMTASVTRDGRWRPSTVPRRYNTRRRPHSKRTADYNTRRNCSLSALSTEWIRLFQHKLTTRLNVTDSVDLHTHDILTDQRTRQRSLGRQHVIDRWTGQCTENKPRKRTVDDGRRSLWQTFRQTDAASRRNL